MRELPTYTIPDGVYATLFNRSQGISGVDKKPLQIFPKSYPVVYVEYVSATLTVTTIITAIDFTTPASIDSIPRSASTRLSEGDTASIVGNVDESQSASIVISPEAQKFPTLISQSGYTTVADNGDDNSTPPTTIIGLATGGAIASIVALAMMILMCTRRRRSGRYRQSSVTGLLSPVGITTPSYTVESSVSKEQRRLPQEIPSSLKSTSSSSRVGSNRGRHSKHITWKDQVFSNQSFIKLPPLPPHPTSPILPSLSRNRLRIGEGAQETESDDSSLCVPPENRVSYQSFSSPTLDGECTSIYSSVPPSPTCVSALSPIPYLFPTPHPRFQRSQIPSPHYNSVMCSSNEFNESYATITCASIYTFLPSSGRRSLFDSTAHEPNPNNIIHRSSIRYSGSIQNFHPSFSYLKSPALLSHSRSCASQKVASQNRFSSFIVSEDNDGDSISSVSSTGSSILDYSVRSTPWKPRNGGVLTIDSSSPHSFDDSPPSGGLTSPPHRKRPSRGDLTIKGLSSMRGYTLEDTDSPRTPGSRISPNISSPAFIPPCVSERVLHDVFFDLPDGDTCSPTLEDISTRHFSCSMPTRPRFVNSNPLPPPYLQAIPPTPTRSTLVPGFCECDSPTLPRDSVETQALIYDNETPVISFSRRIHGGVESTYSPTLSIVNFYTMENRTDSRFPSVNLFTPVPSSLTSAPYHGRSSSVPLPITTRLGQSRTEV